MAGWRVVAVMVALGLSPLAALAQQAGPPAGLPLGANLAISGTTGPLTGAVDLNADIKPNVEAERLRSKAAERDELCSSNNVQAIDMGRGMATSVPKDCRKHIGIGNVLGSDRGRPGLLDSKR
jgi:hypothetical protein